MGIGPYKKLLDFREPSYNAVIANQCSHWCDPFQEFPPVTIPPVLPRTFARIHGFCQRLKFDLIRPSGTFPSQGKAWGTLTFDYQ
ncbi:MAG: hypothetical protein EGQ87_05165 [Clostridiales bacterium]|nr:hypothetical protein [Clostridiales bacterium]